MEAAVTDSFHLPVGSALGLSPGAFLTRKRSRKGFTRVVGFQDRWGIRNQFSFRCHEKKS